MAAKRKPAQKPGEAVGYQSITEDELSDAGRKRLEQLRKQTGIAPPAKPAKRPVRRSSK